MSVWGPFVYKWPVKCRGVMLSAATLSNNEDV